MIRKRIKTLIILILLIGLCVGGYYYWQSLNKTDVQYIVYPVTRGEIENTVNAVGTVQPSEYVDVGVQISGQIQKLHVKTGQYVAKGFLLAELDPTIHEAKLNQANANLDVLKAQLKTKYALLKLYSKQYRRYRSLLRSDAIAQKDVEQAESQYETTKAEIDGINAQIKQSEAELEIAQTNLGYTKIIAPMSGSVVSLPTREGQTLNANQQTPVVLRIANMKTVTVWAQVSEADILKLKVGQSAYFTVLGLPDKRWKGTLKIIYPTPELVNNAIFYNVLFEVPNDDQILRIQMTVQVFFILEKTINSLIIPISALQFAEKKLKKHDKTKKIRNKTSFVYIQKKDGSIERRNIKLGIKNSILASVESGLNKGDMIVTGITKKKGKSSKKGGLSRSKHGGRYF